MDERVVAYGRGGTLHGGNVSSFSFTYNESSDSFMGGIVAVGDRRDKAGGGGVPSPCGGGFSAGKKVLMHIIRELGPRHQAWKSLRTAMKRQRRRLLIGPFHQEDGLLHHLLPNSRRRLCIPRSCVPDILHQAQDDRHHFGRDWMLAELDSIHFKRKLQHVTAYIDHCAACTSVQTLGELKPIRAYARPFQQISHDFITDIPLVPSHGTFTHIPGINLFDQLLVVSCKPSKKTLLVPSHSTYKSPDWAISLLWMLQLCDWGLPQVIISDRDPKFTAQV